VGNESCIEIEWVGHGHWLDLFTDFVSLNRDSHSIVRHAVNYVVQW